jgi:outer membrane protein OmpA-like peptidoglycan-associated protein/tetratricopeptide (TPR) repeat protein
MKHSIPRILGFLIVSLLLSHSVLLAQEQDKEQSKAYMEQAQLMIDAGSIALEEIRDVMVQAAEFDSTNVKANFEAGHLYLQTINRSHASKYLHRVHRQAPEYAFDLEYWIGLSYHVGLKFDDAIEYYTRYKEKFQRRSDYHGKRVSLAETERRIAECEVGKTLVANPKGFRIVNLGPAVNSEYEDYAPVFNEQETEIVFTSRRKEGNMNPDVFEDNKPWEDIFYSEKEGDTWQRAQNIGEPISDPNHESTLFLSRDGMTLYIYRDEGNGDIYFSSRKGGKWTMPESLTQINSSEYSESSMSISSDNQVLYFASNRPGGLGGLDIYSSRKDSRGNWQRPHNLGPGINTAFDEEGPFIDFNGKTLYFSSKGRKGMGEHDIYKASVIDAEKNLWSEPENLGYPINTPDNDVFFVMSKDGNRAYYASVRDDGLGYDDIYRIEMIPAPPEAKKDPEVAAKVIQPVKFSVRVFDAVSKTPLPAKVTLVRKSDNATVASINTRPGAFDFSSNEESPKDYQLSVELQGYVFQNLTVTIPGATGQSRIINRTVELRKLQVGVTSVLRNIYFEFNRASLKPESYAELNKLENMMRQNSSVRVEIAGHTDNYGTPDYNMRLSLQRASAVRNFLTGKGIDPGRIQASGYGATRPLASNDDEESGREINRRVEFKVLAK